MSSLKASALALAAVTVLLVSGCDLIEEPDARPPATDASCERPPGSPETVIVGEDGTLLVRDGRTWEPVNGPWGEQDLVEVAFQSDSVGFAVGDAGALALTQDGGENWFYVRLLGDLVSVASPDGCTSVVSSNGSRGFRTVDDGDTWEETRIDGTQYSWRGGQIAFSDDGWGVAVGAQRAGLIYLPYYPPGVLTSDDDGTTWNVAFEPGGFDGLRAVSLVGSRALAVGYGGFVVLSIDRGRTWGAPRASGLDHSLFAVHLFADGRRAVAVGEDGAIYASGDGGRNWTAVASPTAETLWDVTFLDESYGVAIGDGGTLLVTTDGGESWVLQDVGTDADLYSISLGSKL